MPIQLAVDGVEHTIADAPPNLTLLQWLRQVGKVGTKEGCAEGDCGACTVVIDDPTGRLRAVNACILLLPMLHGRRIWTVEGIGATSPHPVQTALVEHLGSQCGYCTPGVVMSMYEAWHRDDLDADWKLDDQLCGNLCRCTGYRPIREAALATAGKGAGLPAETPLAVDPLDYQLGDRFVAPTSLAELRRLLRDPEARLVAGGTDLGLEVTQQGRRFPLLVSVEHVPELHGITVGERIRIGAATDLVTLEAWSATGLPVLHRMLRYFGSRQIKHRATLGGNLCNASPIGDLAPVMLALDASFYLDGLTPRFVAAADFFTGYRKTSLLRGEVLVAIEIPIPVGKLGAYKVSRRRELDISAVSGCFRLEVGEVITAARIAYGGVAATPIRLREVEKFLVGRPWSDEVATEAASLAAASVNPLDDLRGSATFRRTLVRNLLIGFREETRDADFRPLPPGHCGTVVLETR